jgi:hypothetical protein
MSHDPLLRAARALRETRDGVSAEAALTRARLLAHASLLRKRRRSATIALLPLAAAFVMSSAWAAVTGRLPGLAALWRSPRPTPTHSTPAGPPLPTPDEIEDVPPPIAAASDAPVASAPVASARRASSPSASSRAPAPAAADVEESIYADAHKAHFVARDPASALRGWDAYLAAYPNGRFALEARYNRALTLVRLGQVDGARAALLPFADGSNGGYRQQEARALLDALDAGP